jgi:hypothetical protein
MGGLLTAHLDKDDVVSFDVHLALMNASAASAALPEASSNGKRKRQPQPT